MPGQSRRSFLAAALAFAGGCAGGFIRGPGERVLSTPASPARKSSPVTPAEPEPDVLPLYEKDPVYPGGTDPHWRPDLSPIPRAVWAPESPIGERMTPMGRTTRITVHHEGSETPNDHTALRDVAADLRDIRRVHLRDMNAGDIGYHYIIDRAGRVWQGRSERYRGAHAGGEANRENLGIMLLGNFDVQRPTERQLVTLREFLKLQMLRHRIPVSRVFTHRELRPTRCPGKHLQAFMDLLRKQL